MVEPKNNIVKRVGDLQLIYITPYEGYHFYMVTLRDPSRPYDLLVTSADVPPTKRQWRKLSSRLRKQLKQNSFR